MEDIERGKHEEGRTLRGKTLREEDIKRGRHCPCDLYVCPLRVYISSFFHVFHVYVSSVFMSSPCVNAPFVCMSTLVICLLLV